MRIPCAVLVLFVATSALAQKETGPKLIEFTSESGKYKVLLPGKPTEENQTVKTAIGDIKVSLQVVEVAKDLAVIVAYNEYPEEAKNKAPAILKGIKEGLAKADKVKTLDDITFGKDKSPGLAFHIARENKNEEKGRVLLVGNKLYQVRVHGSAAKIADPSTDKIIESFTLTK